MRRAHRLHCCRHEICCRSRCSIAIYLLMSHAAQALVPSASCLDLSRAQNELKLRWRASSGDLHSLAGREDWCAEVSGFLQQSWTEPCALTRWKLLVTLASM